MRILRARGVRILVGGLVPCLLALNTFRFLLKANQRIVFQDESKLDVPNVVPLDVPLDVPNVVPNVVNDKTHHKTKHNDESSFSACILWMDDNHRLEEWLAYHYYLLKLRYVVLNIDPWSKTSPQPIIDRWNDKENKYNLNMTIVVMNDKDFVTNYTAKIKEIESERERLFTEDRDAAYKYGMAKTNYHRSRQIQFYKTCSTHLVEQNRTWTSYHDTDEFITFADGNAAVDFSISRESEKKMESPGYVLDRLNEIKLQLPPDTHFNDTGLSCLVVDRKLVIANELSTEETNYMFLSSSSSSSSSNNNAFGIIPEGLFDINSSSTTSTEKDREIIVRKFETLRYKYFQPGGGGMPKSFIDLSQPNPKLYINNQWHKGVLKGTPHRWHPHKAMHKLCIKENNNRFENIKTLVEEERFTIHHYLGSFESYSFRDDARQGGLRSYEIWKERSNDTLGEYSHVVRPWLRGFVDLVGGSEVASYLLQDAGRFPEDYNLELRIDQFKRTYDFDKNKRPRRKKKREKKNKTGDGEEQRIVWHDKILIHKNH